MKKISNIIIYIIVFVIILASFIVPDILLKMQEQDIQVAVYKKDNTENNNSISVEAEKIYLVKAIHDIENESNAVYIQSNKDILINKANGELVETENIVNFEEELLKLKEYNILENLEIDENTDATIGIADKFYQKDDRKYILNSLFLRLNNKEYKLEIENKTGKILYISLEKDNLYSNSSKEEIMNNYIKYLDLYIIDDWKLEDNMLKSKEADLVVNLVETEEKYIISIHSTGKIFNIYEYDNIIK